MNVLSPHDATGWQLCVTVASIWHTHDDVLPSRFTAALRYLLQIWNGVEDWWHNGQ